MALTLDHLFVVTEAEAPAGDLLGRLGFVEGARNSHPGQGTANRRFHFANLMLELLYVRDAREASTGPGARLRLVERSSEGDASPFGILVHADGGPADSPFPGWPYHPDYLPGGPGFHVGDNADRLAEPLCVCLPGGLPRARGQPRTGDLVTEVRIDVPVEVPSAPLLAMAGCRGISVRCGRPHLLRLTFNEGRAGRAEDLREDLPIVLCW